MFADVAKIEVVSGKGGDGAVSFRHDPFVPNGGPDGGDGGKGGDVIFVTAGNVNTLSDYRYKRKFKAQAGQPGGKKNMSGAKGENLVLTVPVGTLISDAQTGRPLKDLTKPGERWVAAIGGRGGRGNSAYKSSIRQAPNFAEAGGLAVSLEVELSLKLVADVGLVGFPNVGKSTLLRQLSNAKPKVGNYHFTTLNPMLGTINFEGNSFVLADIPGLIEGAHQGAGLGDKFLKHLERTKLLLHVVDIAGSEGRSPLEDIAKINNEIRSFSEKLAQKPQVVAFNKSDLVDGAGGDAKAEAKRQKEEIAALGFETFEISGATGRGLTELVRGLSQQLANIAAAGEAEDAEFEEYVAMPAEMQPDYEKINIDYDGNVPVLTGKKLLKLFNSTNFNDHGSLRYFYNYLEQSGVIEQLRQRGLADGDTIRIFKTEMEWEDDD